MPIKSVEIAHNPVTLWETYHRSFYPKRVGRGSYFYDMDRERIADGGYGRIRFKFPGSRADLESFFEYGLGRDIKVFNEHGDIDYQGFIFSLVLNTGIHILRKSLQHVFNRVWGRYDATSGASPTQRSTVLDDASSQARFGIIERVVGGGQQSGLSAMDQAVQNKLSWFVWPMIDPDFGAGRGEPYIEVVGVGYQQTLKWRVYNQTALTGNIDLSTVATAIITACGQFIESYNISTNVIQVPREYDMDRKAFDALSNLAAMGDSAGNRWLSRVEAGRVYVLGQAARII